MKANQDLHFPESQFHAYLDGELGARELATFEAHIEGCVACRNELRSLQQLFQQIESLPQVEIASDLSADVVSRIDARRRAPRLRLVLAVQLAISALFFWLTWPLAEPYFPADQTTNWEAVLAEAGSAISTHIEELSVSAAMFSEQITTLLNSDLQSTEIEMSENLLLPLLASATLLWLVGNRLLLTKNEIHR